MNAKTILELFLLGALGSGMAPAGLRADWNPDSEPTGSSFGVDGVWDDLGGTLGDQWAPNPAPQVVVVQPPPPGVPTVATGSSKAIAFDGSAVLEIGTFEGRPVFNPAIDTGDASIVLLVAPNSLSGGRQVIFESGGDRHGISLVLIGRQLTLTVSQRNRSIVIMQATVDLSGIWVSNQSFLRVVACLDHHPPTGERASIVLDVTNGSDRVAAGDATNDPEFSSWCGPGLSGLGKQSGSIGGDLGGAVTNLFGGGPYTGMKGLIGRLLVYDHALCGPPLHPTVTGSNKYWWSASLGWVNVGTERGTVNGLVVGEMFCSGWIWSASVGWIHLGDGAPEDGIRYRNKDGADFGVNMIDGRLVGYAWAPSFGWINFGANYPAGPDSRLPRVDLLTGKTLGYAWSASAGWINLGEGFAGAETGAFAFLDTDDDGISDAWERHRLAAGGLPDDLSLVGGAGSDSDGDRRSDLEEFNEDTDPFDASDRFKIIDLIEETPKPGVATVEWTSKPSRIYRVFLGDTLQSWSPQGAPSVGDPTGTSSALVPLDPAVKIRDFVRIGARRPLTP